MEEETDFESDGEDLNEIFELFQLNEAILCRNRKILNSFVTKANIGYLICKMYSIISDIYLMTTT